MDLRTFIEGLIDDGAFEDVAQNQMAQFGTDNRPYLGPTLLPEVPVQRNMYRESDVRYRTVIANDGTRYSPAQKKSGGEIAGSFLVELGHSDIAREFTADMYDTLQDLLGVNAQMDAAARVIGWSDDTLNEALIQHNEKQRWQALVNAEVIRVGDNGMRETVQYPDPTGHRVTAGGDWTNDAYDPWLDILGRKQFLADKGYNVNRIITTEKVKQTLSANPNTARRVGQQSIVIDSGSVTSQLLSNVSLQDVDTVANSNGLPNLETYDRRYYTQTQSQRFFPEATMLFVCTTGRDTTIENTVNPEDQRFVPDTLGYTAVGRAVGQQTPGRVLYVSGYDNKPPRLEGEGWQTSLPVITEPEALATIHTINTI